MNNLSHQLLFLTGIKLFIDAANPRPSLSCRTLLRFGSLHKSWEYAKGNLQISQTKMKAWYDEKARERSFKVGDKVLLLLPFQGNPLKAKFTGPYIVEKVINYVNHVINTLDRKRTKRWCHINMIKSHLIKKLRFWFVKVMTQISLLMPKLKESMILLPDWNCL